MKARDTEMEKSTHQDKIEGVAESYLAVLPLIGDEKAEAHARRVASETHDSEQIEAGIALGREHAAASERSLEARRERLRSQPQAWERNE